MSFFVSKELQGKLTEDDIIVDENNEFSSLNPLTVTVNIMGDLCIFPVDLVNVKKNKIVIRYLVNHENSIFDRAVDVDSWLGAVINVNGKSKLDLTKDYTDIKLKKIVKEISGYNYKITIIMYKRT